MELAHFLYTESLTDDDDTGIYYPDYWYSTNTAGWFDAYVDCTSGGGDMVVSDTSDVTDQLLRYFKEQ